MLIPYSMPLQRKCGETRLPSWNDPVRSLYPHHAEFWPQEMPEHVRLLDLSRRLARKRRKLLLLKLLKMCLGRPPREKKPRRFSKTSCEMTSGGRAADRGSSAPDGSTLFPETPTA
ncbi:hypothetical protein V1T76_28425 [Roseibium sp. FZY0029]|uniref:hypothetical protein n=1 Tax=Roseibium sp. FZY0029 TaxID=3116647 RepID=UPI002EB72A61|nr:hypothetical protein [Roseibium sp. FZY0029]